MLKLVRINGVQQSDPEQSFPESGASAGSWAFEVRPGVSAGPLSYASVKISGAVSALPAAGQTSTASAPNRAGAVSSKTVASVAPSWIDSLSTASIRSDMSAAMVNGQATYSGLLTLLNNVASSLSNTTLSAAQFADLKTIAANLNSGAASAYLTYVMNALVMGNSMNATWTGGGASSVTLGNLAAGASATQFSELIGKWFLGTDLPSSKVAINGASPFSVSYSDSTGPLFGTAGPSITDVNQGRLGDCYLELCLAEVAYQNPSVISSMITANGNGTYGVRFIIDGAAQYVTVNSALANGGISNRGPDIWASFVEKAYAQLQAGGVYTGNTVNYGNSWSTIGNGGVPDYALLQITGSASVTDLYAYQGSWVSYTFSASGSVLNSAYNNSTASIQTLLIADLAAGDDVILSSWTNAKDSSGKTTLIANHAMSVYGFDAAAGMFQIRNPWGSASGQSWDTTFEVGLSTLLAAGDTIEVDSIGARTGASLRHRQLVGQADARHRRDGRLSPRLCRQPRPGCTGNAERLVQSTSVKPDAA